MFASQIQFKKYPRKLNPFFIYEAAFSRFAGLARFARFAGLARFAHFARFAGLARFAPFARFAGLARFAPFAHFQQICSKVKNSCFQAANTG
jgi:hypothetical protein